MPRDKLLSLIHTATENERITAPIPIPTLTELLGDDAPRGSNPEVSDVVVRFTPPQPVLAAPSGVHMHVVERSHWVVAISAAATILVGVAVIFFA
jgi:hypothetical protein